MIMGIILIGLGLFTVGCIFWALIARACMSPEEKQAWNEFGAERKKAKAKQKRAYQANQAQLKAIKAEQNSGTKEIIKGSVVGGIVAGGAGAVVGAVVAKNKLDNNKK